MTPGVARFVSRVADAQGLGGNVIEVGARNVNGTVRHVFDGRATSYTGVDLVACPGYVDVVADAMAWAPDELVDGVVCCEVLEHVPHPWLLLVRLRDLYVRETGWLVLTTRGLGFPRHDWPSDYTRWTPEGLAAIVGWAGWEMVVAEDDPTPGNPGVFAYARARP